MSRSRIKKKKLRAAKFSTGSKKRRPFPGTLFICKECSFSRFTPKTAEFVNIRECPSCGSKQNPKIAEVIYGAGGKIELGQDKTIPRGRSIQGVPSGTFYIDEHRTLQKIGASRPEDSK